MIKVIYNEDGSINTIYNTGVIFAFAAPGVGTVPRQVGMLVRVRGQGFVFVAGPKQLLEGDFDALCAVLA